MPQQTKIFRVFVSSRKKNAGFFKRKYFLNWRRSVKIQILFLSLVSNEIK